MNILRTAKRVAVENKGFGLFSVAANSRWRSRHLLILCYHGIAMGDEHDCHPEMFLPPETFDRRLQILKDVGANVLPLKEALRLLKEGKLPPLSVSITFDDGWSDFYRCAYPMLQKHGMPATVYLTTYYCLFNRPIFRFAIEYMMWKRREYAIENQSMAWLPAVLDLRMREGRADVRDKIVEYSKQQKLSGKQKDDLACEFASLIGFDYASFLRERLLHLMNPEEVQAVAKGGIDIQLHTHRHRTPVEKELFLQEIELNRNYIREITGEDRIVDFCYPSGANQPSFLPWLREGGVESATTCIQDYSSSTADPLLMPRLLDQYGHSEREFESWVTGFSALLPKRRLTSLAVAPE